MSSPEENKSSYGLDGIVAAFRSIVGSAGVKEVESLLESAEIIEESTNIKFFGFELRRNRRVWGTRRRRRVRWVSIIGVLVVAAGGILKLLITN